MLLSRCSVTDDCSAALFDSVSSVLAASEIASDWSAFSGVWFGESGDLGGSAVFKLPCLDDNDSVRRGELARGGDDVCSDRSGDIEAVPAEDGGIWGTAAKEPEKVVPCWEAIPCDDARLESRGRLFGVQPDIMRQLVGLEPQLAGSQQLMSPYLTEAGQAVYDAVYRRFFGHLFSGRQYDSLVELDLIMNDITNMLLGTVSATFDCDVCTGIFRVREGPSEYARILGVGVKSFHSLLNRFLDFGTSLKRLEMLCDMCCKDVSHGGMTGMAFGNALLGYLSYIKECVLRTAEVLKSSGSLGPLHLYHGIEHLWEELRLLEALFSEEPCDEVLRKSLLRIPKSSALLQLLLDAAGQLDSADNGIHKSVLLCLIDKASRPYLEWLDKWLCVDRRGSLMGARSADCGDPISNPADGYLRLAPVEDPYGEFLVRAVADIGETEETGRYWDEVYQLDTTLAPPAFLSDGLDRAVLEAGKAARLLLAFQPDRQLVDEVLSTNLSCTRWTWFGEVDEGPVRERMARETVRKVQQSLFQAASADGKRKREARWEKIAMARAEKAKYVSDATKKRAKEARDREIAKQQAWRGNVESFLNERENLAEAQRERDQEEQLKETELEAEKERRRREVEEEEKQKMFRKHESQMAELEKQRKRVEWRRRRLALADERNQLFAQEYPANAADGEPGRASRASRKGEANVWPTSPTYEKIGTPLAHENAESTEEIKQQSMQHVDLTTEADQPEPGEGDMECSRSPALGHPSDRQDSNVPSSSDTSGGYGELPASDGDNAGRGSSNPIAVEYRTASRDGSYSAASSQEVRTDADLWHVVDNSAELLEHDREEMVDSVAREPNETLDGVGSEHGDTAMQGEEARAWRMENEVLSSNPFELSPEAFQFQSTATAEGREGKIDEARTRLFFEERGQHGNATSVPYMLNKLLEHCHDNLDAISCAAAVRRIKKQLCRRCDLINRSAISLFVFDLDLRSHLAELEQIILMGNGNFVVSLTRAVFDRIGDVSPWSITMAQASRAIVPDGQAITRALSSVLTDTRMDDTRGVSSLDDRLSFALAADAADAAMSVWDPFALETFDFLRIHYRAPRPLDVIITPRILQKYNRIFVLLVRLQRVDVSLRRVYTRCHYAETRARRNRVCRLRSFGGESELSTANGIKRGLSPLASRTWARFRLEAHRFTDAFRNYVFRVAIGATWHSFLESLGEIARGTRYADDPRGVRDSQLPHTVSELRAFHEAALDQMLARCLLKRPQKSLAGIVNKVLSIVLALDRISASLERDDDDEPGSSEEAGDEREVDAGACDEVEKLYGKFRSYVISLVRVLRKQGLAADPGTEFSAAADRREISTIEGLVERPGRSPEFLHHFLVMLDFSEFYEAEER